MQKVKVRRMLVIDENRRMVGMLGLGDISAKAATTSAAALKTLAAHHA